MTYLCALSIILVNFVATKPSGNIAPLHPLFNGPG